MNFDPPITKRRIAVVQSPFQAMLACAFDKVSCAVGLMPARIILDRIALQRAGAHQFQAHIYCALIRRQNVRVDEGEAIRQAFDLRFQQVGWNRLQGKANLRCLFAADRIAG